MTEFKSPFLESVYRYMTTRGYSKRTISTYIYWIRYLIRFHKMRHPTEKGVWMPESLERKYQRASRTLPWQYLFPSSVLILEPGTLKLRRHHVDESSLNKLLRKAGRDAGIDKQITCHTHLNTLTILTIQ